MLTDLENLRESVGALATLYHPWVRNLSRQDRLVVYLGADGSPNSVALVAADDAKQLVTIAKDNHNAFPAFRTKSRSLRHIQSFCSELRGIFHRGPLARLLAAVARIADEEEWFATLDKLVLKADIPTDKKEIDTIAFDLTEESVLQPGMRQVLSEALFEYEQGHETSDSKMPNPNLPILGLSYLMSKNVDIPSFERYGLAGQDSFPLDRLRARQIASSLEWITDSSRKGKTWRGVPGATKDSKDLMIVYVSGAPDVRAELADFFGDVEEPKKREELEAFYAALCESVVSFFSHHSGPAARSEFLELLLLRKISPGVTRIESHLQPSIEQVKRSISEWIAALANTPPSAFKTRFLVPGQLVRTLQRQWIRNGENSAAARFDLKVVYDMLFQTGTCAAHAAITLETAYQRGRTLLLSGKKIQPAADYFTILGLALYYRGHRKEKYMESTAYKFGEFLAMADLIHKCYCQEVRGGAMPPNLIGNAHFDIASSSPAGALALMQSRLKLYTGWAQTRGGGLAKWSLKRIGEISGAIAGQLPTKFSTDEKAQLLLGYLARTSGEAAKQLPEEEHA
ncbi:MAG: hypothetical protein LAO56_22345 [Acidobacteriia bacterium]|nr:hypothetical protein [Terriglobia bacterium]